MVALDIIKTVVTPMQRLVVEWTAAATEPAAGYTVTASSDRPHVVTVNTDATLVRMEQLYRPGTYAVTVSNGVDTGTPVDVSVSVSAGMGSLLRQAMWDCIYDAGVTLDGRAVEILHDGYFRPASFRGKVPDGDFPAVEILPAELIGQSDASLVRSRDSWRLAIRLHDADGDTRRGDAGETGDRLAYLREVVQAAVYASDDLNLSVWGVHSQSWRWQSPRRVKARKGISTLEMSVVVYVQQRAGRLVME